MALQGAGKSLGVPARNRLIDDLLQEAVQALVKAGAQAVQVVNIGCGMVRAGLAGYGDCIVSVPIVRMDRDRHGPLIGR